MNIKELFSSNKKFELREWKPAEDIPELSEDQKDWNVRGMLILGMSESGKSTVAESFLTELADRFSSVYLFTGSDDVRRFVGKIPQSCIIREGDPQEMEEQFQAVVDLNRQHSELSQFPNPILNNRAMTIFEDLGFMEKLKYSKAVGYLLQVGRHDHSSYIIISHAITQVAPNARKNAKIIGVMQLDDADTIKGLRKLCAPSLSQAEFDYLYNKYTQNYSMLVFDKIRKIKDSTPTNWIFYYKVDPETLPSADKFRFGCREFWQACGEDTSDPTIFYASRYVLDPERLAAITAQQHKNLEEEPFVEQQQQEEEGGPQTEEDVLSPV